MTFLMNVAGQIDNSDYLWIVFLFFYFTFAVQ